MGRVSLSLLLENAVGGETGKAEVKGKFEIEEREAEATRPRVEV